MWLSSQRLNGFTLCRHGRFRRAPQLQWSEDQSLAYSEETRRERTRRPSDFDVPRGGAVARAAAKVSGGASLSWPSPIQCQEKLGNWPLRPAVGENWQHRGACAQWLGSAPHGPLTLRRSSGARRGIPLLWLTVPRMLARRGLALKPWPDRIAGIVYSLRAHAAVTVAAEQTPARAHKDL